MSDKPRVRVPQRALPTMLLLESLPPERKQTVETAMSQEPATASVSALRKRVAAALGGDDQDDAAREVLGELFGLAALAATHGYSPQAVADSLVETPSLELADAARRSGFASFLAALLGSDAIRTLGKAADLAGEHDRVFHTGRIITDLTPIFGDPVDEPVGAVLTHRLRVSYFGSNSRVEELELAFSSEQLEDLENMIRRARSKAASLEALLERVSLPTYDTHDEEDE